MKLYSRVYLFCLALFFAAVLTAVFVKQGYKSAEWPWYAWLLLVMMFCAGCWMFWASLYAAKGKVSRWAEAASAHHSSFIVALVAWPIYYIIKRMGMVNHKTRMSERKKRR